MLEGSKVRLRGLELKDAETLWENVNKPQVQEWLTLNAPMSLDEEQDFVKRSWKERKEGKGYVWGVVEKASGNLVGAVGLHLKDKARRVAELGYWLNDEYWGQGLVSEAAKLVVDYGFEQLNLHKVYARAFKENKGSLRVMEKAGMKYEYTQREEFYMHGAWRDLEAKSLLKKEWAEQREEQ